MEWLAHLVCWFDWNTRQGRNYPLRIYFETSTKAKIFKAIILSCIMYNYTVNLNLTQAQGQKLQTIDLLAAKIIGKKHTSIENEIKKHSVMLVHKCVQKETWKKQFIYVNKVILFSFSFIYQNFQLRVFPFHFKFKVNLWANLLSFLLNFLAFDIS